jgi:SAM-dependent methyltransferase
VRRLRHSPWLRDGKFRVLRDDFLTTSALADERFDVVTAVSVLEHMEGDADSAAMRKIAALLRPGGCLLLSVPFNDLYPREYHVEGPVYGNQSSGDATFFQRHYSRATLGERLLEAAPFEIEALFYAGHYGRPNLARRIYVLPWPWKAVKVLYNWAAPLYVPWVLQVSDRPPADPRPTMLTADTAFVFLRKPS